MTETKNCLYTMRLPGYAGLHFLTDVNGPVFMTRPPASHDAFFKKFLSDIDIARDFLQIHLPDTVRQHCDFSTLAMESGSFIEDNLRHQCSDMLYSLETGKGKVLIYCLVEHQSRAEKLMAFRLMRYSIAAMQRHLEQGHQQLPVVVPLLFYHGPSSPYPYTTQWLDCFTDRALALKVYTKPFPLVDVTAMEDEEILTHRRVALLELVQKHIRTRDMMELGQMIADLLNQWTLNPEQFRGLMYYIFERGNTESPERFLGVLAREAQDYREQVMSIAQQLEQKGLEKGLQQGQQQGRQEATLEMARQFLANGVERHVVKISTGLSDEELDNLPDSN